MLKYSDFVKRYLLNEGGPGSGPQPKDGGTSDNNTDKKKSGKTDEQKYEERKKKREEHWEKKLEKVSDEGKVDVRKK